MADNQKMLAQPCSSSINEDIQSWIATLSQINRENPDPFIFVEMKGRLLKILREIAKHIKINVPSEEYYEKLKHELENLLPWRICDLLALIILSEEDEKKKNYHEDRNRLVDMLKVLETGDYDDLSLAQMKSKLVNFYLDVLQRALNRLDQNIASFINLVNNFNYSCDLHQFSALESIQNLTSMNVRIHDETNDYVFTHVASMADVGIAVREILRNACKARANSIELLIYFDSSKQTLVMQFDDNGTGIDEATLIVRYGNSLRQLSGTSNDGNGFSILNSVDGINYTITNRSDGERGARSVLTLSVTTTTTDLINTYNLEV